jgi:hypothetical protein
MLSPYKEWVSWKGVRLEEESFDDFREILSSPLPNALYGDVYLDAALQGDGQSGLDTLAALEWSLSHIAAT